MMTALAINRASQSAAPAHVSRVLVIGGGLAGMAAAVALESAGLAVTLVEARKRLGGRASSFDDPQSGEELDNSQHVLLGCCTNLLDFYRRVNVLDRIRFHRTIHFRDAAGRQHELWGMENLPAPLHLAPALAVFGALSWVEKFAAIRAMTAMLRLGRAGREKLADVPFGDWLDEHRQPDSLVQKFYDPLLIGSLNELSRRGSAKYAIQVFQDAMLANSRGYVLGLPDCPLGQLYSRVPVRDVRLGVRVTELRFAGNRICGAMLSTGELLDVDSVVIATNHHTLGKFIPAELAQRDARFAHLDRLESVPILGAHLWFDRPVMADSHAAMLSGPLQWVFRKDRGGRAIRGVISAARDWVDVPREPATRRFDVQLRAVFPDAREARLLRNVVVIEKRATFAPLPGVDRLRPAQAPPPDGLSNLYLAGDYTQTHWPATMEGAVRSGYLAAEALLSAAQPTSSRRRVLVADLTVQWPANLLGG